MKTLKLSRNFVNGNFSSNFLPNSLKYGCNNAEFKKTLIKYARQQILSVRRDLQKALKSMVHGAQFALVVGNVSQFAPGRLIARPK